MMVRNFLISSASRCIPPVVLLIVICFWRGIASDPLLAEDDLLEAVLTATHASAEKIRSATGTGTYEIHRHVEGEKEPQLGTKAEIDVNFDQGHYSLHFAYEKMLATVVNKDADGTEKRRSVDMKPDSLYLIDDGTTTTEVKFSPRITPAGCAGSIFESRSQPLFPFKNLAQLGRQLDFEGYVKNWGKDAFTVVVLPNGVRRISAKAKFSEKIRVEFDADPMAGFNVTAKRVYNEPRKEPIESTEVSWKKAGEI